MTRHAWHHGTPEDMGARYFRIDGDGELHELEPDEVRAALDAAAERREPTAPAKSEPGGYWSPWLEWRGGPCPLPGRVECQFQHGEGLAEYRSTGDAHLIKDWRREGRFRYRAPDKLGWLPRGDWIPPAELWADHCSVRLEWLVDDGVAPYSGDKPPSTWRGVTHVRLVARERKVELPEGFRIDEDGALWSEFGPVLNRRERDRYRPAAIRQAVDAWLREMGGE